MTADAATRAMHIGIGLDHFDIAKGGLERALADLMRFLLARGHRVTLFTMDEPEQIRGVPVGVALVRVQVSGMRAARERAFARNFVSQAHAAGCDVTLGLRHCPGVDVYYPHGGTVDDSLRARYRGASRLGRTVRELVSALSPKHRWFREAERRLLADEAVRIVAVSRLASDALVRAGAKSSRVTVAENGVDVERFHPRASREDVVEMRARFGARPADVVVFFASHDFRLKGLGTLLEAFARAVRTEPALRLAVAGRDSTSSYRKRARRLGIERRVQWLGEIRDLERWLRAADVFALPTSHDPCSLVTLEALASGCPVITSRYNGAVDGETISGAPGVSPAIVLDDPDDAGSLAVALSGFAESGVRSACAKAARASVEGRTWERCHAIVEGVLASAAAERGRGGTS